MSEKKGSDIKEHEDEVRSKNTASSRYGIPSLPSKIDRIEIWLLQSQVLLFGSTSIANENYGTSFIFFYE